LFLLRCYLLDGPTPPEEKNGPQKTRGRPGGGTRGRPEKTLELVNDGLGKDETKTQKLRESASPI
jgi:hypothetical protein